MERDGRSIASFVADGPLVAGETTLLDEAAAHHARVRRLVVGEPVRVTDGRGTHARGSVKRIAKSELEIAIADVEMVPPPARVTLCVPVADRDRMLWLAEKCCELGIAVWQPVVFERSRSVSPRGEGAGFLAKVRARMRSALEQSGGAWLPEVCEELAVGDAVALEPAACRLLLDAEGVPILEDPIGEPVAVACGPEGGITGPERERFVTAGWRPVRVSGSTLRFETAAIAGVAIARAVLTRYKRG